MKVKFFAEDYQDDLAKEVNAFIRNKKLINISYSITQREVRSRTSDWNVTQYTHSYRHCCCVVYEDKEGE